MTQVMGFLDTGLQLRLGGLKADRQRIQADLELAHRELKRAEKLRKSNSIAQKNYDQAREALVTRSQQLFMDWTRYINLTSDNPDDGLASDIQKFLYNTTPFRRSLWR